MFKCCAVYVDMFAVFAKFLRKTIKFHELSIRLSLLWTANRGCLTLSQNDIEIFAEEKQKIKKSMIHEWLHQI